MHTKTALGPLFGVLLLAVTGCEGLLTTEVVNEVSEAANETNLQNCAETTGALRGYVRFEGLEGEASTPGYDQGYSRLFSLDSCFTIPVPTGGRGSRSVPKFEPIRIVKERDTASPGLFQALVQSFRIPTASIALIRDSAEEPFEYYRYDLEEVYVTEYQDWEFDHHNEIPNEVIGLSFAQITITYTPMEIDGSPGLPVTVTYDSRAQTE